MGSVQHWQHLHRRHTPTACCQGAPRDCIVREWCLGLYLVQLGGVTAVHRLLLRITWCCT